MKINAVVEFVIADGDIEIIKSLKEITYYCKAGEKPVLLGK